MKVHAVRLAPGTDLADALKRLVQTHALRAGFVLPCAGSLSRARLRMPGAAGEADAFTTLAEPLEIVSLTGTLCPEDVHVHIALSRRDGTCVGGHLVAGCVVHTTAELVIGEATQLEFLRPLDPTTGYGELSVRRRPLGHLSRT